MKQAMVENARDLCGIGYEIYRNFGMLEVRNLTQMLVENHTEKTHLMNHRQRKVIKSKVRLRERTLYTTEK